jgi:hypothetical protein
VLSSQFNAQTSSSSPTSSSIDQEPIHSRRILALLSGFKMNAPADIVSENKVNKAMISPQHGSEKAKQPRHRAKSEQADLSAFEALPNGATIGQAVVVRPVLRRVPLVPLLVGLLSLDRRRWGRRCGLSRAVG